MDCQIEPCPKCSFPGIWSQPILDFEDARSGLPNGQGYPCGMTDTCLWVISVNPKRCGLFLSAKEVGAGGEMTQLQTMVSGGFNFDIIIDFIF